MDSEEFGYIACICYSYTFKVKLRNMESNFQLFDTVALLKAKPAQHLKVGQVGAIVERLNDTHVIVEFLNPIGETIALADVAEDELFLLQFDLENASST